MLAGYFPTFPPSAIAYFQSFYTIYWWLYISHLFDVKFLAFIVNISLKIPIKSGSGYPFNADIDLQTYSTARWQSWRKPSSIISH